MSLLADRAIQHLTDYRTYNGFADPARAHMKKMKIKSKKSTEFSAYIYTIVLKSTLLSVHKR